MINSKTYIIISITLLQVLAHQVYGQADTTKILFLGNSFTGVNDLPGTFEQLATKAGRLVYVSEVTPGGYTLNGHSQNPASLQQIAAKDWDYVVLQEQSQIPSIIPNRETLMYPYAITLDSLIHINSKCTHTTFYMTWGHKNGNLGLPPGTDTYEDMQQRLRSGYMTIADSVDALVAPVGWAWRYVRQNYSQIELYSSDDYHPSMAGTYLAACVFYSTFYRQSPVGIAYDAGLDPSVVQDLQFSAGKIVLDSLTLWNHGIYNPNPKANYSFSINGFQVSFVDSSFQADSLFWDFGDGSISTQQNPTHTYATSGSFQVKLISKNSCGNDTLSQTITILPNSINESDKVKINIQPIPVENHLFLTGLENHKIASIKIFKIDGKLIYAYRNPDTEIDVSFLSKGIYLMEVNDEAGNTIRLKFIKK